MSGTVHNSKKKYTKTKNNEANIKKKLEYTTRIRIDPERLEDSESLDTSFLEGRIKKDFYSNKNKSKKINFAIEKIPYKIIILTAVVFCVFVSVILFFPSLKFEESVKVEKESIKEETVSEKEPLIDDNYLFVGDFYTEDFNLEEVSFPYVKISYKGYNTKDILDNMNEFIYQYNPSVIFLEIGMNDLKEEETEEDIIERISKIIDQIKENRPLANVYVESIYPINSEIKEYDEDILGDFVSIDKINSLNKKIKEITKEKKVHYLDVYQELVSEGQLKAKYTDNGVYLNDQGYNRLLKLIREVVEG